MFLKNKNQTQNEEFILLIRVLSRARIQTQIFLVLQLSLYFESPWSEPMRSPTQWPPSSWQGALLSSLAGRAFKGEGGVWLSAQSSLAGNKTVLVRGCIRTRECKERIS